MSVTRHSTTNPLQIRNELAKPALNPVVRSVLRRLPQARGAPIRLEWKPGLHDRHGAVHAGSFLRERRIAFHCNRAEFGRILVHELFHFVWLRLGNPARHSWERLIRAEKSRGELGWSAQWRKDLLKRTDISGRSRAWRLYCCESFCDTAAWLYSGRRRHPEFTLAGKDRRVRRRWFEETIATRGMSL